MEFYNNELYHHGIRGMKWGKRNGPPYPLSGNQKSKAEKSKRKKVKKYLSDYNPFEPVKYYNPKTKRISTDIKRQTAKKYATLAVATYGASLGTAAISSAAIKTLANKGRYKEAQLLRALSKKGVQGMKGLSGLHAVGAGSQFVQSILFREHR